jgi:Putative transposase
MTGAPSRWLRTNRARATCSSTWTSCVSIQRYPTPTSTCADIHPCGLHHGTCGNLPPTPERRRKHFRPFGFCRPPFQSRRRSRPPSESGPTRTRTTSSLGHRFLLCFHDALSLHAGVHIAAGDDAGRERLFRYGARPAMALDRLRRLPDGRFAYRVKYARAGRAKHRVMAPLELLARIAAILPPPRFPSRACTECLRPAHPGEKTSSLGRARRRRRTFNAAGMIRRRRATESRAVALALAFQAKLDPSPRRRARTRRTHRRSGLQPRRSGACRTRPQPLVRRRHRVPYSEPAHRFCSHRTSSPSRIGTGSWAAFFTPPRHTCRGRSFSGAVLTSTSSGVRNAVAGSGSFKASPNRPWRARSSNDSAFPPRRRERRVRATRPTPTMKRPTTAPRERQDADRAKIYCSLLQYQVTPNHIIDLRDGNGQVNSSNLPCPTREHNPTLRQDGIGRDLTMLPQLPPLRLPPRCLTLPAPFRCEAVEQQIPPIRGR